MPVSPDETSDPATTNGGGAGRRETEGASSTEDDSSKHNSNMESADRRNTAHTDEMSDSASEKSSEWDDGMAETALRIRESASPSSKSSSMATCYHKAVETQLFRAKHLQVQVWAMAKSHHHLAARFEKYNKLLSLPASLLSAVTACLGVLVLKDEYNVKQEYNKAKWAYENADCREYEDGRLMGALEAMNPVFSFIIIHLSILTTILVTINTHYGFCGLATAHKEAELSLKRLDGRIERFVQELQLGGGIHTTGLGGVPVDMHEGREAERRRKANVKLSNRIEDLLERYALLSKELGTIEETAPSLRSSFTGWTVLPWWISWIGCRCPRPEKMGKETINMFDLHRPGMLLRGYELQCNKSQMDKSRAEDEIARNVEKEVRGIDAADIEAGASSFGRVFNRSNFDHVRVDCEK